MWPKVSFLGVSNPLFPCLWALANFTTDYSEPLFGDFLSMICIGIIVLVGSVFLEIYFEAVSN
jgi:hypothetical protein